MTKRISAKTLAGPSLAFAILAHLLGCNALAAEWYQGGNLHDGTLADWRTATASNRLATAADFATGALGDARIRAMGSASELRPYAAALMTCIDGVAADSQVNLRTVEVAAACFMLMGMHEGR